MSHTRTSRLIASAATALAALGGAAAATAAPASAANSYAAIAYSPATKTVGYSVGPNADAPARALSKCAEHGDGCQLAASVTNGCVALALRSDGGWYGGYGATADEANNSALSSLPNGHIETTLCP
jgi:hypothetical protein